MTITVRTTALGSGQPTEQTVALSEQLAESLLDLLPVVSAVENRPVGPAEAVVVLMVKALAGNAAHGG